MNLLMKPVWRARPWQLIAFLWVCYFLNHADRQVIFALFPLLQNGLGYTDAQLGLTGALFSWIYGLCSPLAGILGDRLARSKVISGSVLVWSAITATSGFAPTGGFLLTCRGLLGVAESMFMPAAYSLIAQEHPPESRSRAIALFGTSQLLGVALSGALSGYVAERTSWRVPFWLFGALGMLYALPLYWFLRQFRESRALQTQTAGSALADFGRLLRIPTFLVISSFSAVGTFSLFLVYSWLPTFLYDKFSLSLARAGFEATFYLQIGSGLGLLAGGTLADHWYKRSGVGRMGTVTLGLVLGAPCLFWLGAASTLEATRVASVVFGFFTAFMPANQAACCFDVVPDKLRASTIGMLNLLGAGVAGAGPFLGGLSRKTIGVDQLMTFTAGLMLLSAVITAVGTFMFVRRDQCANQAAQSY